jgi:hypothetical protein
MSSHLQRLGAFTRHVVPGLVLVGLGCTLPRALHGQSACREFDAEWLRRDVVEMVTAQDSGAVVSREMHGLPALRANAVRVVTDQAICAQAARVYYRHHIGPPARGGVTVVEAGDAYLVYGDSRAGEWSVLTVYNRNWEALASVLR